MYNQLFSPGMVNLLISVVTSKPANEQSWRRRCRSRSTAFSLRRQF